MTNKINLALQVLPKSLTIDTYSLVDKAIEVIQQSGVKYQVCPFETVLEGNYQTVMEVAHKAWLACFEAGATEMMVYIKMQMSKEKDVTIEDKMEKYS